MVKVVGILVLLLIRDSLELARIIQGTTTEISKHPYQLALLFRKHLIGGAALISPKYGLSAAHCFPGPGPYSIRAGSSYALPQNENVGITVPVQEAIIHWKYNNATFDYDIAIIKLLNELELNQNINVIKLPDFRIADKSVKQKSNINTMISRDIEGKVATITGWGVYLKSMIKNQRTSNVLRTTNITIWKWEKCREIYRTITPRMFCGLGVDGADACQGDSGGPLVVDGVLRGLVSWGTSCGEPKYPGIYTNVVAVRDFIRYFTQI